MSIYPFLKAQLHLHFMTCCRNAAPGRAGPLPGTCTTYKNSLGKQELQPIIFIYSCDYRSPGSQLPSLLFICCLNWSSVVSWKARYQNQCCFRASSAWIWCSTDSSCCIHFLRDDTLFQRVNWAWVVKWGVEGVGVRETGEDLQRAEGWWAQWVHLKTWNIDCAQVVILWLTYKKGPAIVSHHHRPRNH